MLRQQELLSASAIELVLSLVASRFSLPLDGRQLGLPNHPPNLQPELQRGQRAQKLTTPNQVPPHNQQLSNRPANRLKPSRAILQGMLNELTGTGTTSGRKPWATALLRMICHCGMRVFPWCVLRGLPFGGRHLWLGKAKLSNGWGKRHDPWEVLRDSLQSAG